MQIDLYPLKDVETFHGVEDPMFRAFNRMFMARNIVEMAGHAVAERYLAGFSHQEREKIFTAMRYYRINGEEMTQALLSRYKNNKEMFIDENPIS